jgi:hypothetical protein
MTLRLMTMSAALVLGALLPASAQDLDFGAWCSDIARHSPDRCSEARPDDKMAYDRYLESIELFNNELNRKTESRRIERERVDNMGDVTPDRDPGRDSAAER